MELNSEREDIRPTIKTKHYLLHLKINVFQISSLLSIIFPKIPMGFKVYSCILGIYCFRHNGYFIVHRFALLQTAGKSEKWSGFCYIRHSRSAIWKVFCRKQSSRAIRPTISAHCKRNDFYRRWPFFKHSGIDFKAVFRVGVKTVLLGQKVQVEEVP